MTPAEETRLRALRDMEAELVRDIAATEAAARYSDSQQARLRDESYLRTATGRLAEVRAVIAALLAATAPDQDHDHEARHG